MNTNSRKYTAVSLTAGLTAVLLISGCGSGESNLEAGIEKLRENNYKAATKYLEKAVNQLPDSASAYCNLGITCWKTGRHKEAATYLRKAAQLCPDDPRPLEFLARVMMDMQNWKEAHSLLVQADKRVPASSRILTTMALEEAGSGNNPQALSRLTQALETDPTYAPALYNMAVLHRDRLKNREEASNYFSRYVKVAAGDPHVRTLSQFLDKVPPATNAQPASVKSPKQPDADPLVANARKAIEKMEFDRALDLLRQAIRKNPSDPTPLWELAILYDKHLNFPGKAGDTYSKFVQQFSSDPRTATAKTRMKELQPQPKKGDQPKPVVGPPRPPPKDLTRAQEAFANGCKAQKDQKLEEAIAYFNQALELDSSMSDASYNLGFVYREKNDLGMSIKAFGRAVELDPNSSRARYMLANIHSLLNENKQAVEQLNKILKADPDYAKAHLLLGNILHAQNDLAGARAHFAKFLKLAPTDPVAPQVEKVLNDINRNQ